MATPLLPLFPLGTVLLPGAPLPLRIFEERYRRLIADLLELPPGHRRFGVVAIREGREVGADGVRALHEVGCVAVCTDIEPAPDGTYNVRTVGTTRFRITALDSELPYLRGTVEELPEQEGTVGGLSRLVASRYGSYRTALSSVTRTELAVPDLPADPRMLSYLVAATVLTDLPDRQRFLAEPDAAGRLAAEARWLARETQLLTQLSSVPGGGMVRVPSSVN